ncbi:MAG: SDR family NAD(P)-dependent oxidoreductase [Thauera sp.]|nr:SDR family NAD(P)-dependent oxidoreductase [Thauera sp.]
MPAPEACSTSAEPARDPRQPSAAAPAAAVAPAAATDSARASAAASPAPRIAVVIGTGGIGGALAEALRSAAEYDEVVVLGRRSTPALDLLDEASIAAAARWLAARGAPELVIDATGILHGPAMAPEKSWRELDPATLAQAFAINAIGPALLMKHFLPLLPRDRRAVFATLSAKVGSIGDNRLGGWYAYRASKAALNQFVRTASIELRRGRPQAICVALHPGTVDTGLSAPFAKSGLQVQAPALAAQRLLTVLGGLKAEDSGQFFDYRGERLPW